MKKILEFGSLKIILALLAFANSLVLIESAESPIFKISNGFVQGTIHRSRTGKQYYRFLGIPYAKPPIGHLRFQPPEPASDWSGTLFARRHGAFCLNHEFFFLDLTFGKESCLFLNVMSPVEVLHPANKTLNYPVIVFFHGGQFHMGNTNNYKGKFFMDEEVILVTVQYRLGIFGFLSTNDDVIPGNMGLKDQVMALRWVQENIQQFGGDPNQVTIMGQSSGGTSVQHLMLSPLAKGLFHRAISMSGNSLSEAYPWNRNITNQVEYIANYFKCPLTSTKDFAKCMQTMPVIKLTSLKVTAKTMDYLSHPAYFAPVVEPEGPDAFLTEQPISLLESGKIASKVPWMTGFNDNEGLLILAKILQFPEKDKILTDMNAWNAIAPNFLFYYPQLRPDAAQKIYSHYFENSTLSIESYEAIGILSNMISDRLFFKSGIEAAKFHSQVAPVYTYYYTYHGFLSSFNFLRYANTDLHLFKKIYRTGLELAKDIWRKYASRRRRQYHHFGAAHSDELFLLFDFTVFTEFFTNTYEKEMSRIFIRTITDFAHTEKPVKFNNLEWPELTSNGTAQFMNINVGNPEILENPVAERLKFWDELDLPRP
ncbi:unnamed protein product [Allacma fusca]|uniref:Carboxylic ester hydrolase n=1 Tax=Allacma fusca TaxID=39272 RepID=A0A8J2PYX4_9HEXA|nr:unnamed protein product [Allacma fusca]